MTMSQGIESRALDPRVQQTGCESWLYHLQLGEPGARSLSLSFLICKVGMIASKDGGKIEMALPGFPASGFRKLQA